MPVIWMKNDRAPWVQVIRAGRKRPYTWAITFGPIHALFTRRVLNKK